MSAAKVTVSCPVAGCEWSFSGHDVDARWQLQVHEQTFDHEAPRVLETQAEAAPDPAENAGGGRSIAALEAREREATLAQEITVRCADCLWETAGTALEARRAWAAHRRDEHSDDSGLRLLERMEAGPRKRRRGAPKVGGANQDLEANLRRTRLEGGGRGSPRVDGQDGRREAALAAIRAYAAEHGAPPRLRDSVAGFSAATLQRIFGSFAEAIEQAGFPRPRRGARRLAVPPPGKPAKGRSQGRERRSLAPEPAPAQGSEGTRDGPLSGSLVELAERAEQAQEALAVCEAELDGARESLLAALAALEAEIASRREESGG
ncbi:MAG TPA: hypothetical protein VFG80_03535 [Myxococcota bacterium]|nr:hypothetical protein [Myxococcota bacterium]